MQRDSLACGCAADLVLPEQLVAFLAVFCLVLRRLEDPLRKRLFQELELPDQRIHGLPVVIPTPIGDRHVCREGGWNRGRVRWDVGMSGETGVVPADPGKVKEACSKHRSGTAVKMTRRCLKLAAGGTCGWVMQAGQRDALFTLVGCEVQVDPLRKDTGDESRTRTQRKARE